jgi:hypothetical protein
MLTPALSARIHREAEDAVAAIVEMTHAADQVAQDYRGDPGERIDGLETLSHAIRNQTSWITAVCRIAAQEGERDSSPAGASLYRSQLRLELSRLEEV